LHYARAHRLFTFVVIKAAEGAGTAAFRHPSQFFIMPILYINIVGTVLSVAVDLCALFLTPLIHCLSFNELSIGCKGKKREGIEPTRHFNFTFALRSGHLRPLCLALGQYNICCIIDLGVGYAYIHRIHRSE
jgi:hypothetical protein